MINENHAKSFCREDLSLIENYDKAIADATQVWHCHHRRETIFSRKDLKEIGEYYNRPACELIFLTPLEHIRLHQVGKHLSTETRKKLSEANNGKPSCMKGKHLSEEHKLKLSEAKKGENNYWFGKHHSAETRKKMSEANKGENHPMFGKYHSAEARKKMSEAHKGNHWYNNGVKSIRAKTCPEGFVPGRIVCNKRA